MILGRIHLILLFDTESKKKIFKADLDCVGCIPLFLHFLILLLGDSSTLSSTFGFGGM